MFTALTPIADFPGLQAEWTPERPYFERAFDAGAHGIIRVRYRPVDVPTDMVANIPVMPRAISVMASASLIDATGAVRLFAGRGIVRPAYSFSEAVRPGVTEAADLLLRIAGLLADELVSFAAQADSLSILIPPPEPPTDPVAPAERGDRP